MSAVEFTSKEMLALSNAIACKIVMCEKYAETLKSFINSGVDCCDNLEKQEAEIKMYKDLWNKVMKG